MKDFLIIKEGWRDKLPELPETFEIIEYTEDTFNKVIFRIIATNDKNIIIVNDFHPELKEILTSLPANRESQIIRVEPQPFTHPTCHFSAFFLFSIFWLLKNPELVSSHSYMTLLPANMFNSEEIQHIVSVSHSAGAFNLGILALALHKNLDVKRIHLVPERSSRMLYEVLKNEFIHSVATLMKVLEITKPNLSSSNVKVDSINIKHQEKLQIPGHPFLTREFISGFRKYAPFWKEHLFDDHFALLSAIYAGKEDSVINDRIWIRIMFELLNASLKYPDKMKIARRIFPVYALYLNSINESIISERFNTYIEILKEEYGLISN